MFIINYQLLMNENTSNNINSTELLRQALINAEIILAHATDHGIDVNKEHIKTIVEAKKLEELKQWTMEAEIEFWLAYKAVSKLIQPVNIESLRAAQEVELKNPTWLSKLFKRKHRKSLAHRSVNSYNLLAIFSIALMLGIQIYSLKGTTLINTIQVCDQRMKQIEIRMGELLQITTADKNNQTAAFEKDRLENEQAELDRKKSSSIQLLEPWVRFISKMFGTVKKSLMLNAEQPQQGPPISATVQMDDKIAIIQEAQNYVLIIGMYILPILYGLLGGFTFVLRSLSEETKKLMFSKESNIKYALRIHLGALAGLATGLFWGDMEKQTLGFMQSLSPLALAFIAGYSVEFLFTGIDRIIANVSRKKNAND